MNTVTTIHCTLVTRHCTGTIGYH